jgi:hypothetical protein
MNLITRHTTVTLALNEQRFDEQLGTVATAIREIDAQSSKSLGLFICRLIALGVLEIS